MLQVHEGQCGLCTHFGEIQHRDEAKLVQIRASKMAPETHIEE